MTQLRKARKEAGLTAIRLAELAHSAEQRVFHIERGRYRPKPDEAERIAAVLNSTVAELFPGGVQQ